MQLMSALRHHLAPVIASAAAILLLAGCGSLFKQPNPNKVTFLLPVMGPVEGDGRGSGRAGTVVSVRPFRIVPEYADKSLTYKLGEVQVERDYYNSWLVNPDAMLTERLREYLAGSNLVGQVQDSGSLVTATHVIEGNILELGGDYRNGTQSAVVSIRLTLMPSRRADSGGALLHKTYSASVPLADREPDTLVTGLGQALEQVYRQFGVDLAAKL